MMINNEKTKLISLINIIKRDFLYSIYINKYKYILFTIFIILISTGTAISMKNFYDYNIIDLFFYAYKDFGYIKSPEDLANIPINWILVNILIFYNIGDFISEDLKKNSIYTLVRTKNFTSYWISKCIWVIVNILVLYLLLFIITFIIGGSILGFNINWDTLSSNISRLLKFAVSPQKLIATLMILYTLTSISLAFIQVYISLLTNSRYAFLTVVILLALAICVDWQVIPSIHSMIMKHSLFDSEHNLFTTKSITYNLVITTAFIYLGYKRICKKEIY